MTTREKSHTERCLLSFLLAVGAAMTGGIDLSGLMPASMQQ